MKHTITSTTNLLAKVVPAAFVIIFLYACKKNNHVGLADDNVSMTFIDTFSVNIKTHLQDTVATSGYSSTLLGYMSSANFGATKAISYLGLKLSSQNKDLGYNYSFDKAELYLTPDKKYGDDSKLNFDMYELGETIEDITYDIGDSLSYNSLVLTASLTNMELDSTNKVSLSSSFGEKLLNLVHLNSQETFDQNYFGLALVPREDFNAIYRLNLGTLSDSSRNFIRLHYNYVDTTNGGSDVVFTYYDIYIDNSKPHFTATKENLSGTGLETIGDSAVEDIAVFKNMTGKQFSFYFPEVSTLHNIDNRLIINKVNLSFEVEGDQLYTLDEMGLKSLNESTGEEEMIPVLCEYLGSGKYVINGNLLAEEVLFQIQSKENLRYLFYTVEYDVISQMKVIPESIQLEIYYSEIE